MSSLKNKIESLSRRRLFSSTSELLTAGTLGFSGLSRLLQQGAGLGIASELVSKLGKSGYAQALTTKSDATIVLLTVIDKTQQRAFQSIPGALDPMNGIDGAAGDALIESSFRGRGFTELFAAGLVDLPSDVSICINNAWSSNVGGHNLSTANLGMENGGINYAFEEMLRGSGTASPFGAIGLSLRSDANSGDDAFVSSGGQKMRAFDSVMGLRKTIKNAVDPLVGAAESTGLLKRLDSLSTADVGFRDVLTSLAEKMAAAVPALEQAELTSEDPILQQVDAVIACSKAGISNNFMITVPHDDTNGGGDLTNTGGEKRLSPLESTRSIGLALSRLHRSIPNLIVVTCSDGGRGVNNSDRAPGMAMLTGPSHIIRDTTLRPLEDVALVGQETGEITLSTGARAVATQAHWLATALKAAGHEPPVPYVAEALIDQ